jgi:serine/threonine protein kinase
MGKDLVCRPEVPAIDLKILCKEFRSSLPNEQEDLRKDKLKCSKETVHSPNVTFEEEFSFSSLNPSSLINAPDSVFHLLYRLLSVNPADRITAEEALGHPFIIEI